MVMAQGSDGGNAAAECGGGDKKRKIGQALSPALSYDLPIKTGRGMRMETVYRRWMARVIRHIHQHLEGDLSLEGLAAVAAFSTFHFHR
jgi:AraC-like DNA-binding protein